MHVDLDKVDGKVTEIVFVLLFIMVTIKALLLAKFVTPIFQ